MGKDWKYIVYLCAVVGVFVIIKLMSPKQYDWSVTLAHEDKNPFGTYALHQLLPELTGSQVQMGYKTLYELKDSIDKQDNIFILATTFNAQKADVDVLLEKVSNGATAFLSANYFSGALADSLGIASYDNVFQDDLIIQEDTAMLQLTHSKFDSAQRYPYRRQNIKNYFGRVDSVAASVVARNESDSPVAVKIPYGKGALILNTTPMVFTNIHLLSHSNHQFAASLLSLLPPGKVWRTEFYHLGRMEAGSPLRFVLQNESLRWAYYCALAALLIFMFAEVKRKQRMIPVIAPLANSTLEFVATIGNLYFQKADHKNIAEKKITFFFEQVRNRFFMATARRDGRFVEALAKKSGHDHDLVASLVNQINEISAQQRVTANELKTLNERIEKFWSKL